MGLTDLSAKCSKGSLCLLPSLWPSKAKLRPEKSQEDAIWMAYFYLKKVVRLEVAKVCGIPDAHTEIGQEKLSHPTGDADALPFGEVLPDSCPSRQGFAVVKQNEFMNHSWNILQQSSWYNCTCVSLHWSLC